MPDMKSYYAVEYTDDDPNTNTAKWWQFGESEDQGAAIAMATKSEHPNTRVRQFQVQYFGTYTPLGAVVPPSYEGILVRWLCLNHPEIEVDSPPAAWYDENDQKLPRCALCHRAMWLKDEPLKRLKTP